MSVSPKTKRERSKNTYLQRSLLLDWVGAFGAEDIGIDSVSYTHLTLPTT